MRTLLFIRELIKRERINYYYNSLKGTENLSVNELRNIQKDRLLELLRYIKNKNSFYSRFLTESGEKLNESSSNPFSILQHLPVIDKSFIKDHYSDWENSDHSLKSRQVTSGSTGVPFVFFSSTVSNSIKIACKTRFLAWHGVKRGEKQICYLGMKIPKSFFLKAKIFINNKLIWNQSIIDSTRINPEKEIKRINKNKPITIYGYPSTIYEIAHYSLTNDYPIKNSRLKGIIFSGESHSPSIKLAILKAFHVAPLDEYCTMEGYIACTCEHHRLHINEDVVIAEILNEAGKISGYGKGELLVTHLYSKEFPFVRYKTGDIVEITEEQCKCKRPFKIIKNIDGRAGSFIFNGQMKISDAAIATIVIPVEYIRSIIRFQIVQNDRTSILLKIQTNNDSRSFVEYESYIRKVFDKVSVSFEYLNEIAKENSGKFRVIVNNIEK
jgi:phenylacetate-CoA ligase